MASLFPFVVSQRGPALNVPPSVRSTKPPTAKVTTLTPKQATAQLPQSTMSSLRVTQIQEYWSRPDMICLQQVKEVWCNPFCAMFAKSYHCQILIMVIWLVTDSVLLAAKIFCFDNSFTCSLAISQLLPNCPSSHFRAKNSNPEKGGSHHSCQS